MFEPRPEIRTATRTFSAMMGRASRRRGRVQVPAEPRTVQPRSPGFDPADLENRFSSLLKRLR